VTAAKSLLMWLYSFRLDFVTIPSMSRETACARKCRFNNSKQLQRREVVHGHKIVVEVMISLRERYIPSPGAESLNGNRVKKV
jgi:hypothetical protein